MRPIFAQDGFYFVISSIPEECGAGWRPVAVDPGPWGTCFGAPGESGLSVGDVPVPPGLMEGRPARRASGRDSSNNVLVYWSEDSLERPSGGAGCWLFDSSARSWSANRGLAGVSFFSPPRLGVWEPRLPGHNRTLLSAAAACSGGRLEVLGGIFSTGRADCLAGWGGGMPRYFRRGGAVASRGFGWSRGLLSGPAFRRAGGPGLACRQGPSTGAAAGPRAALRAVRKTGPEGGFLALFARRFPVRRGCRRSWARWFFAGPQKTDLCKKSARGCPATGCRVYALGSVL